MSVLDTRSLVPFETASSLGLLRTPPHERGSTSNVDRGSSDEVRETHR
jgi:hypothetical protein